MAKELRTLGWDYLMFALFIAFTVLTPLWKRLFGKAKGKQRSKADYVFATGGVSLIAIMISIARGTLGVRTVLGYPSELFYRGSAMWEIIYGMVAAYPIVCFIFVPVYFNLGITSVYQYIDLRVEHTTSTLLSTHDGCTRHKRTYSHFLLAARQYIFVYVSTRTHKFNYNQFLRLSLFLSLSFLSAVIDSSHLSTLSNQVYPLLQLITYNKMHFRVNRIYESSKFIEASSRTKSQIL